MSSHLQLGRRAGLLAVLAALALVGATTVGLAQEHRPPTLAECAALVMTDDEREQFEELDAAGREAFAEEFWRQRDPTPGTPENEVVVVLRRRAARVDRLLGADAWRTPRGRVFLLKGLPLEIERRSEVAGEPPSEIVWRYVARSTSTTTSPTIERGAVRFVRSGDEFVLEEMAADVKLDFDALVASVRNELALELAAGAGAAYQGMPPPATSNPIPTRPRTASIGDEESAPTSDDAPDPAMAVAPEVRIWLEMVYGGTMRDELGLRSRLHFFPTIEGTYTVLAFDLAAADLLFVEPGATPEVAASGNTAILEAELAGGAAAAVGEQSSEEEGAGESEVSDAGVVEARSPSVDRDEEPIDRDPLRVDAEEADRMLGDRAKLRLFGAYLQGPPGEEDTVHAFILPFFELESDLDELSDYTDARSIGVTLAPGEYRLAWGVLDESTGRAVTRDRTLRVPAYSENDLALTEPVVAGLPHRESSLALTTDELVPGLRLGKLVLDTNIDNLFARDDVIDVVLLVNGWDPDPAQPGKPLLEVEYRLVAEWEGERRVIARLPTQSVDFAVLSQQIPLEQVDALEPGGAYRIEVRVKDMISGNEAYASTVLRIVAPAEPLPE